MRHINRPYIPDETTADFLYGLYQLLKDAPPHVSKWARQRALESAAECPHSWRSIGISENALREIAAVGKRTDQQRGHWFARHQRYSALFGNPPAEMDRASFIRYFFEHDTTVIITKAQNNAKGDYQTWGKIIPIPEGLFPARGYSFAVGEKEVRWIRGELAQLDAAG